MCLQCHKLCNLLSICTVVLSELHDCVLLWVMSWFVVTLWSIIRQRMRKTPRFCQHRRRLPGMLIALQCFISILNKNHCYCRAGFFYNITWYLRRGKILPHLEFFPWVLSFFLVLSFFPSIFLQFYKTFNIFGKK